MKWRRILIKTLIGIVLLALVVLVTRPFWVPRLYYGLMLYVTRNEPILAIETKTYQVPKIENTTQYATLDKIEVPLLPGKEIFEKNSTTSVRKIFFDTATSTLVIFRGPQFKTDYMTPDELQSLLMKKAPGGEKTNYKVAKSFWSLTDKNLNFWSASRERMGDMYGLMVKGVRYSICRDLLEFENTNHVKGLFCPTNKLGNNIISVFLPDDTNYEVWLLGVSDDVRDNIIGGIRAIGTP